MKKLFSLVLELYLEIGVGSYKKKKGQLFSKPSISLLVAPNQRRCI